MVARAEGSSAWTFRSSLFILLLLLGLASFMNSDLTITAALTGPKIAGAKSSAVGPPGPPGAPGPPGRPGPDDVLPEPSLLEEVVQSELQAARLAPAPEPKRAPKPPAKPAPKPSSKQEDKAAASPGQPLIKEEEERRARSIESQQSKPLTGDHRTGGPVWPAGAASSYPWDQAKDGNLKTLPERRPGLKEVIYSARRKQPRKKDCGEPCVAHCIAGQPRSLPQVPGLYKALKHRLIDKFSDDSVVFGLFPISAMVGGGGRGDGTKAFVRQATAKVGPRHLVPAMDYMEMDRALMIEEPCQDGNCLESSAGITCSAKELGLKDHFDKATGKLSAFCDVQIRRFQSCMHLVREYEQDRTLKFDFVTRARPDVYIAEVSGPASKLSKKWVYTKIYAACGYGGMDWQYVAPRFAADVIARFPDDFQCKDMKRKYILPKPCMDCLGCECMLAAWLLANNVDFSHLPWDGMVPLKFCGPGCAADWVPTQKSICKGAPPTNVDFCAMRKTVPQNFYNSPRGQ